MDQWINQKIFLHIIVPSINIHFDIFVSINITVNELLKECSKIAHLQSSGVYYSHNHMLFLRKETKMHILGNLPISKYYFKNGEQLYLI